MDDDALDVVDDDVVDGAFERIRLPVVDPVSGSLVFDALAAGPPAGRLVLLLHGFPQNAHMWRAQLRALAAAGYRAVAVDQRGYSPEARPDAVAAYTPADLVADTLAFADLLGGTRGARVDLVGHDWGGVVAWHVAAGHPERLRTLTVVSTPHPAALSAALASARRPGGALLLHPAVPPARQGRARAARRRRPPAAHDVRGLGPARLRRLRGADDATRGAHCGAQLVSRREAGRHGRRGHRAHPVCVGRGRPGAGPGGGGGDRTARSRPVPVRARCRAWGTGCPRRRGSS